MQENFSELTAVAGNFELMSALLDLTGDDVEDKLNVPLYFQRLKQKVPNSMTERLRVLETEHIIRKQSNGLYSITVFGAVLLANDLRDFSLIRRKEIRVVQYQGTGRREIQRSKSFEQGYAVCISELLSFIDALLPSQEPISNTGERLVIRAFPPAVVRELLVNAMIHQDLSSQGDCVLFEILENRLEITNPGTLLVEKEHIIDQPPKSRNPLLAGAMQQMHLCEESGSGWDRIVELCECDHLPSPEVIQYPQRGTKVVLYTHIDYADLTREQKLWACYLHACVLQMDNKSVTNATLRERFGLDAKSASSISRLLAEAVKQNLLKLVDESVGSKAKRYVPYWA